jgi:hypothetical protein
MPTDTSKFDVHKAQVRVPFFLLIMLFILFQLVTSLSAVADSMRNCAKMADVFAKIMQDTEYFPETAEALHGTSHLLTFLFNKTRF